VFGQGLVSRQQVVDQALLTAEDFRAKVAAPPVLVPGTDVAKLFFFSLSLFGAKKARESFYTVGSSMCRQSRSLPKWGAKTLSKKNYQTRLSA
jgi:hypothetical protein